MRFLAAAVQMVASSDKEANLQEAENWVRQAHALGAKLVALPEVFNWRGPQDQQRIVAEPIPGTTSNRMADLARALGIYLLAGSVLEAVPGEEKVYNTSLLFGPPGDLVGRYRKIHLFDVEIEGGVAILESRTRNAGEEVVVTQTELCPMGLTICYDLRFPELYRRLALHGAQIIFVPSAFTVLTGEAHWEPLLRARAIENLAYVIAPDQFGEESPASFATYGHSMIVDPWGKVLAQASEGPGLILAEIDLAYLEKVRTELPALSHRRDHLTF